MLAFVKNGKKWLSWKNCLKKLGMAHLWNVPDLHVGAPSVDGMKWKWNGGRIFCPSIPPKNGKKSVFSKAMVSYKQYNVNNIYFKKCI